MNMACQTPQTWQQKRKHRSQRPGKTIGSSEATKKQLQLIPARRPKRLVLAELPQRGLGRVGSVAGHGVTPPGLDRRGADHAVLWVLETEEDDDGGDGDA